MSRSLAVIRKVKAGAGKGDRGLQKASNDEQLLLIHDTEKILGHHDRYFPGGKPLDFTPSDLLPQLNSDEAILHDIVKSRNLENLLRFLQNSPKLNINCTDYDSNTVLVLAVKNGDEKMVELLLEFEDIIVEDALLHAVQLGHYHIVEMILDKQSGDGVSQRGKRYKHGSPAFPPDMTPLELAAVNRKYKLIKLLLARGDEIEFPHALDCDCKTCQLTPDVLERCWSRLRTYEAISSPEYISQTSSDPILTAFELCSVFGAQAELHDGTFREQYMALSNKCTDFALDLLSQCRTVDEVAQILHRKNPDGDARKRKPGKWERVTKAIQCEQKKFVAHPNCQQVLQMDWEQGFKQTGKIYGSRILFLIGRMVSLPFLCLLYLFFPFSSVGRSMRVPSNKYMNFYASYVTFVVFLAAQSELTKRHHDHRGPPNSGLEWVVIAYVSGLTWRSSKMWWKLGSRKYFAIHWHKYDTMLEVTFWTIFALWAYSWFDVRYRGNKYVNRKEWKATDPTLISEGIFAGATVMAFCKLFYFFQTGYSLGPLIVSFSRMFKDIADWMQIYLCVLFSFSLGMARMYYYYKGQVSHSKGETTAQSSLFQGFNEAISTLFWSVYGLLPYESLDIVLGETKSNSTESETGESETVENRHRWTQTVAFTLYGLYSLIGITVLINLLIAMMSNSYAKVEDNVDNEWKFARTAVWIAFMEEESTLPPPYNLVPSCKSICKLFRWCMARDDQKDYSCSIWRCCYVEEKDPDPGDEKYTHMMSGLVQRYLTSKYYLLQLKRLTQRDLNDIRQEVVQTKHATRQILDVVSVNDPYRQQRMKYSPGDINKSTNNSVHSVPSWHLRV